MKLTGTKILFVLMLLFSGMISEADTVSDFKSGGGLTSDHSSILIRPLDRDTTLLAINEKQPLIPASILKCVTTATLLSRSGVKDCYQTRVFLTGEIVDSVAQGDLVVVGSGDPSLNSQYIKNNEDICLDIARTLSELGVREIKGELVLDQTLWDGPSHPESWASADLAHDYGAGSFALNFEDNSRGGRSVANPPGVFESRLRNYLTLNGITIQGERLEKKSGVSGKKSLKPREPIHVYTHKSAPLDEIMRSCMMRSDNQYAEALLRTYAVKGGGKGNTAVAAREEMAYWRDMGAPMEGVEIVDGSGLSRKNRVTAQFIEYVLRSKAKDPYYPSFFPLAGEDGTMRKYLRDTPLAGYVALKTGSMNGIQCYAGYLLDEDYNPTHTIVVILNEMKDRGAARETIKQALLNTLVK